MSDLSSRDKINDLILQIKLKMPIETSKELKERSKHETSQGLVQTRILGNEIFFPDRELNLEQLHGPSPKPEDCAACQSGNTTFRCHKHMRLCLCGKQFNTLTSLKMHIKKGKVVDEVVPEYSLDLSFKEIDTVRKRGLYTMQYFRPNSDYWKRRVFRNMKILLDLSAQYFIDWYFIILASGWKALTIAEKMETIHATEFEKVKNSNVSMARAQSNVTSVDPVPNLADTYQTTEQTLPQEFSKRVFIDTIEPYEEDVDILFEDPEDAIPTTSSELNLRSLQVTSSIDSSDLALSKEPMRTESINPQSTPIIAKSSIET